MPRPESEARTASAGFTLIEVLAAVLIVSLVFGLLLESVTRNLADLGRSRREGHAALLAVERLRELEAEVELGTVLEPGSSEGAFDAPDDDLRWMVTVTPQTLDLPADYTGRVSPSPLFADPTAPPQPLLPGQPPLLALIEVRVYGADEEPETVDPFVLLLTAPADPLRLQQIQPEGAPPNATPQGEDG